MSDSPDGLGVRENPPLMTATELFVPDPYAAGSDRRAARRDVPLRVVAWRTAIGLAVVTAMLLAARDYWLRNADPLRRLIAASTIAREVAPRLSGGFGWMPLHPARAGAADRNAMRSVAGTILKTFRGDRSPQALRITALASLISGAPQEAVTTLQALPAAARNAQTWSDLAAAYYSTGSREGDPRRLADALVAVDAAVAADPSLPEGRFNRALILEALGLRVLARDEWATYLNVDPGSAWSNEARDHWRSLVPEESFKDLFLHTYDRLADPAQAHAFARRYPQEARTWGETEILGRWAAAESIADRAQAAKHLGIARELGAELVRDRGDHMLEALVSAIDRAGPHQRAALAEAHSLFRDGQQQYMHDRVSDAGSTLASAATAFDRGGSPGAVLAGYFVANTTFDRGHIAEADAMLRQLLSSAPPQFAAHRAQLLWQIGIVDLSQGRWGGCITALTESVAVFERLGEWKYAANVREILVEAYDRIGDPDRAWLNRMLVLRALGGRESSRLQLAISSATNAALMDEDWPKALSFDALEIDVAHRIDDPLLHAEGLLRRARIHVRLNDRRAATADLTAARTMIARLGDAAYRSHMATLADAIEASVATDPLHAVALLTGAIDFHSHAGRRMHLPELFLDRARAFRALHDDARAAADLESGVAELERHRESLASGEDRWGMFHAADQLFADASTAALARGDPERAFDYTERARARALLDSLGSSWARVKPSNIPRDTVVIEYAVHAAATIIYVLDDHGIRAVEQPWLRASLLGEVAAFSRAAQNGDRAVTDAAGRALYRRLIAPVEHELTGRHQIAFVPDPAFGSLPFAALVDGHGRYLLETYAIAVEPSAAVFSRLTRPPGAGGNRKVLIVIGADDGAPLGAVRREARAVAAAHADATPLIRDAMTPGGFSEEAAASNVIHFAGHAVSRGVGGSLGSLLVGGGAGGGLDLRQIAAMRLPRTSIVVLAACGTAAGETRATEGTISIARAFLAAGVPSVVATLWPIRDDEAAEFFPLFHRHLARGLAPAEALRATQLEWLRRTDSTAGLWSGVQVIGE